MPNLTAWAPRVLSLLRLITALLGGSFLLYGFIREAE